MKKLWQLFLRLLGYITSHEKLLLNLSIWIHGTMSAVGIVIYIWGLYDVMSRTGRFLFFDGMPTDRSVQIYYLILGTGFLLFLLFLMLLSHAINVVGLRVFKWLYSTFQPAGQEIAAK